LSQSVNVRHPTIHALAQKNDTKEKSERGERGREGGDEPMGSSFGEGGRRKRVVICAGDPIGQMQSPKEKKVIIMKNKMMED